MIVDWSSFLSVAIIATVSTDKIFVNYSRCGQGVAPELVQLGQNGHKFKFFRLFRHLPKNSMFALFPPFVPAHGQPLDPTIDFIDKKVITKYCCSDS